MDFVAILAGGSGTRFWPKSRARRPKQFLAFGGESPLLVETYARTRLVAPPARTLVITSAEHADEAARLLPEIPRENVVGEPAARDTAAAVGLAAQLASRKGGNEGATLLVCPADHRIGPPERFAAAARAADSLLAKKPEAIVVFGIKPTAAATGYGYVEQGASLGTHEQLAAFEAAHFHEKPDAKKAADYVKRGCLWNAGIFAFRAGTLLAELARQMPELARGLDEIGKSVGTQGFADALARSYPSLPKQSIDRGVMEHAKARALVVPDYSWDDVGSFAALARAVAADPQGNVTLGGCVALDARGNVVDAGSGLVALLGVEDLVVVHTEDVTLVCRKDRCEDVKQLLEQVKKRGGLDRHL